MRFESVLPAARLRPYIRCYWQVSGSGGGVERVLPDGYPEWILHLGERPRVFDARGQAHLQARAVLAGQLLSPLVLDTAGRRDTVGVSFWPDGVAALFSIAMADIRDQPVALSPVPRAEAELRQRLGLGRSIAERASVLDEILWRASSATRSKPVLAPVLGRMAAVPGVRVESLASASGWSRRHLERRFRHAVGVSPKTYLRIARFRRIAALPTPHRRGVDWAQVALEEGFSDQSHMIREFRTFAGVTPTRFQAPDESLQAALAQRAGGESAAGHEPRSGRA